MKDTLRGLASSAAFLVLLGSCVPFLSPELSAPTNLAATGRADGIYVTWRAVPGVDLYRIFRYTSYDEASAAGNHVAEDYAFSEVDSYKTPGEQRFSYLDTAPESGVPAYYRVAAVDEISGAVGDQLSEVASAIRDFEPEWSAATGLGESRPSFFVDRSSTGETLYQGSAGSGDKPALSVRRYSREDQSWELVGDTVGALPSSSQGAYAAAANDGELYLAYIDADRSGEISVIHFEPDPDDDDGLEGTWTRITSLDIDPEPKAADLALATVPDGLILAYRGLLANEDPEKDAGVLRIGLYDGSTATWSRPSGDGSALGAASPVLVGDGSTAVLVHQEADHDVVIRRSDQAFAAITLAAVAIDDWSLRATLPADDSGRLIVAHTNGGASQLRSIDTNDGSTLDSFAGPTGVGLYDGAVSLEVAAYTGPGGSSDDGNDEVFEVSLFLRAADGVGRVYRSGIHDGASWSLLRVFDEDDNETDLTSPSASDYAAALRRRDLFVAYVQPLGPSRGTGILARSYR